jgi:chromosome segregation ATPase
LPKDDFYTPTDIDALRMENELLTFEVRFLKTQFEAQLKARFADREAEHEHAAAQLRSRLEEVESQLEESRHQLEESRHQLEESRHQLEESERSAAQLRERLAESERAEQDLVLLLRRLANSPFGWLFGIRQNLRLLEQRYLDTDD